MKTFRSKHRMRAAFQATALLLALLAREQCLADPLTQADPRSNSRTHGQIVSDRDAYRQQVFEQAHAGSPALALEQAKKRPDAFSTKELLQIETLSLAAEVRWGRQQAIASNDPDRLAQTEGALRHADDLLARMPNTDEYAELRRAALAERVCALAGVGRMKDATALYEQLMQTPQPLPAHTLAAVGDAYTYLEKPTQAAQAYELALQSPTAPLRPSVEPHALKPIDVQEGLFFAYLDRGRYEDAQQLLASIVKSTPERADLSEDPEALNEDYARVKKLQAQYLLYTNHTREGVEALDSLRHDAPFDPSLLNARSDGSLVQQRPHAAAAMYQATLTDHPGDLESLAGLGKTALELHRYDEANAINDTFGARFPDSNVVKNFQREYGAYQSPQLIVQATGQKGNSVLADNDWGVDTQLYSQPIFDYWRVFAHQFSGRANTGDGLSVSRVRNGVGGDFRYHSWGAAAEVHSSTGSNGRTGGTGSLDFQPDDHWKFAAGVDSDDNTLPWKAYQAGVTGRSASASVRYRQDDYRYFELAYGASRFSDANVRQMWNATWYERLLNTPRHLVSIWVNLNTSQNTLTNAAYFNPSRDGTAQLTAMYQWTPWRDGNKSFSQRVYATVGGYRQQDFGTSGLWEVRLEQQWQLGTKATLSYGVGVSSQREDRTRETSKLIYLNLNIPL